MTRKVLLILVTSMMIFPLAACTGTSEDSTLPQGEEISKGHQRIQTQILQKATMMMEQLP